jgi:hypothetical protein
MRDQIDGAITVLEGPEAGCSAANLSSDCQLMRSWPHDVRDLPLLGVSDAAVVLQPLSTTTLTGSLLIREVGARMGAQNAMQLALPIAHHACRMRVPIHSMLHSHLH